MPFLQTALRFYHPIVLLAFGSAQLVPAQQNTATIDIDASASTPIQAGFSGISDDLGFPVEYWDPVFNAVARQIHFGWVRFPGGASGDAYNWKTGQVEQAWLDQFLNNYTVGPQPDVARLVAGKGGAHLQDAVDRANRLGASLILCVNAFTDSPQSIGQLAQFVKDNQIRVGAWELANEAYLFTKTNSASVAPFFTGGLDYLHKMQPYAAAIRNVDPNATIAIFADPGATGARAAWDQQIASYMTSNSSAVYWNAISFHYYPALDKSATFAQWMSDETGVLVSKATQLITNALQPLSTPGMKFLITEFDPTLPGGLTTPQPDDTLWGGIYSAEFIMRMSALPQVMYVGPNEIWQYSGVGFDVSNQQEIYQKVNSAGASNMPIDTVSLDSEFNFYLSAQAAGLAVLNGAINEAMAVHQTKVIGGSTVPVTNTDLPAGCTTKCTPAPALYAMGYSSRFGELSVVITNKSASSVTATIQVNGEPAAEPFPVQFVTAADPSTSNTASKPETVVVQKGSSANPVNVPPYSVMRVDLSCRPFRQFPPRDCVGTVPAREKVQQPLTGSGGR